MSDTRRPHDAPRETRGPGGPPQLAAPAGLPAHLTPLLALFPLRRFERGEVLIDNTRHLAPPQPGSVAYVAEGLVRGAWNGPYIAPDNHATTVVAGDGRWVGLDAFKYGANLFRYEAMTPTRATVLPLADFQVLAARETVLDALRSVSLDWCAAASSLSLGSDALERRTLLLLYNLFRLHPRPEIEVRQKDLAELLGVARQSMQPVLKRLERSGLISLGYGEIVVGEASALLDALRAPQACARRPATGRTPH